MIGDIDKKFARAGRRAALSTAALLCFAVGAAFLTVALWLVLVALYDATLAATIIGLGYVGIAAIFLGVARQSRHAESRDQRYEAPARDQAPPPDTPPLMAAFMHGMQAGAQTTSRKQ